MTAGPTAGRVSTGPVTNGGLRARARLEVEHVDGRDRCTVLRSDPPLALRLTDGAVYLAASAAGPLGGDDVGFDVVAGPGTSVEVRSVGATLVQPGARGGTSTGSVTANVHAGAGLRWLPEPTVLVRGCDHRAVSRVDLAATASLVWREELVLGRHGEPGGSVHQRLHVDRDGSALMRNEQALGPAWPTAWEGPAGVGSGRAVGTLLLVGLPATAVSVSSPAVPGSLGDGVRLAAFQLAADAVMVSAVASTARRLRAVLDLFTAPAWGPAAAS